MGNDQSAPDPPPPPSDSSTGTDTPSSTRTPTGTGTASITPNISDATTQTMSVSAFTSRSPSHTGRPSLTRTPLRSPTSYPTSTAIPLILCGNNARYEGIWKTHLTAGGSSYSTTHCYSVITASVGQLVRFTEITQDINPCCDTVYIYDGPTASSSQLVRLIGSYKQYPYNWTSSSNTMTIQFSGFTTGYKGLTGYIDFIQGPSPSASASASVSPSASSLESASPSGSISGSGSPFESSSPSVSESASASVSISQSSSASETISEIQTASLLDTPSPMSSESSSYSRSASVSISYSMRPTFSPSAKATARPNGPPPPLPKNFKNLSLGGLKDLITDLAFYDASQIKDSLKSVGFAAMQQSGGEFSVSNTAFSMKMKAINDSGTAALQLGSTNLSLPPLGSLGTGLAASMIQWTSNPHSDSSDSPIDSPPITLDILDSTGSALSVKNLSTPISFSWTLNASDSKFHEPPFYFARCDTEKIYLKVGESLTPSTKAIPTGRGCWSVPCLLDLWKPLNCTDFSPYSIQTYECPTPVLTPNCLYWSTSSSTWSSDGCTPTLLNGSISCACTHLTDFTSRIDAVAESNKALFANAANVYSLSGLTQYAAWFGIFGGIAALTLLLGFLSMRIDTLTTKKYVKSLCQDQTIRAVFDNAPNTAIYTFDAKSTKSGTKLPKLSKIKDAKEDSQINTKPLSLCQRVMQQHSRVQFLFRYDPRLARVFRLLALFTVQYHSLFITALFYGFTYGAAGKSGMMWYDVAALSIITSLLNFPVVSLILASLGKIGLAEFKFKFPLLNEEYMRRSRFEKYAIKYLENKKASGSDESIRELSSLDKAEDFMTMGGGDEESLLDLALMYLCCKPPKDEDENSENKLLSRMSQKELLVKMITVFKAKYPPCEVYDSFWSYMPCHTMEAWLFLICAGGWLAWCLNYLLLFAASHPASVGQEVMISYATSELTTVFITQPITILITYGLFKLIQRHGLSLPLWIQRFVIIRVKKGVPPLFHFSNPWSHLEASSLTSRFAYSLFVKCPAAASNTNELAYAPTKAIVHNDDHDDVCPVEELYKEIMSVKAELELRSV